MKKIVMILIFVFAVISCQQPTDRGSSDEIDSAEYTITIKRPGGGNEQEFKGVNAKWNPTVLVIDLGPEDQD